MPNTAPNHPRAHPSQIAHHSGKCIGPTHRSSFPFHRLCVDESAFTSADEVPKSILMVSSD